jgi:hypothetical protein
MRWLRTWVSLLRQDVVVKCTLNGFDSPLTCNKLSIPRFVWNFHRPHEATNFITSYSYDTTKVDAKDPPVSDLFFEALGVREYPNDAREINEHPFRGLVNSARASPELHNNQICISIRVPARDNRETKSELDALKAMGVASHFPFIVPKRNTEGNTRPIVANTDHETMLEAAAGKLAMWFSGGSENMDETETVATSYNPEEGHTQKI